MKQQVFVLLACLVAVYSKSTVVKSPRDIQDDAEKQLDELKSIVRGEIMAAHDDLTGISSDFINYGVNVLEQGKIDIQEEHQTVIAEITQIKDLAQGSGFDVSVCTNIREALLNQLPIEYTNQITRCIQNTNEQEIQIIADSTYYVDIYYNRVSSLEFNLNQCRGQILCISPILTEIDLDMVRLPQYIKTEVNAAESFLGTLRPSVQTCSDTKVAEYAGDATAILEDIQKCVNNILNSGSNS